MGILQGGGGDEILVQIIYSRLTLTVYRDGPDIHTCIIATLQNGKNL